jgi:hypothetical protein
MRTFFSIFLICSIFGQASIRTLWALDYQLDRVEYLKNCENKDKPSMHCDGKCYLKKRMLDNPSNQSKEPKLPQSFHEIKDLQLFCEPVAYLSLHHVEQTTQRTLPEFLFSLPATTRKAVFRPPAC